MKPRLLKRSTSAAIRLFKPKVLINKLFDLKFRAAFTFLLLLSVQSFSTPLSGTYTVPGSYSTLAAAITALNTNGISGTVTINIAAGYTETAPSGGYILTVTGTSSNLIIFQKSGSGADPILTAYTGGTSTPTTTTAQLDGIFRLVGSSYITINGIDLQENSANTTSATMMEFGYGFFKQSAIIGCQNDIIENCTITLNKANFSTTAPAIVAPGSTGILVDNATNTAANTSLTITTTSGLNSNNLFIGNTITNVFTGIYIVGYASASPYTYYDQNNVIGRSGKGNTITDFGSGTSALTTYGIYLIYQNNDSICYNTINNMSGGGAAHTNVLYGIYQNTSTNSTVVVNNNSVTLEQGGNAFAFYCIDLNVAGTGSVTVNNNSIGASNAAAATAAFYGIYNQGSNSSATFSKNSFNNITVNTTASAYLIYNLGGGTTGITCTSNRIVTGFTKSGAGNSVYGYYSTAATVTSGTELISQNNFSNITVTGATAVYGIYTSTADAQTKNINTDTLTGWSGGTSAIIALDMDHLGSGSTIYSNYINNNTCASTVYGINLLTASTTETTVNIYSNIISNLVSSAASGTVYGIYQQNTKASTVNIYSNTLTKLAPTGATSPVVYCISVVGGPSYNIYSNSVYTISTTSAATKPIIYGVYSSPSLTSTSTRVYKNTFYGFSATGTGSTMDAIYLSAASTTATVDTNSIYNFNASGTGGTIYGAYISGAITTLNIDSNYINNLISAGASETICGVAQATTTTTTVNLYLNTITNISQTGATSPIVYGMKIVGGPSYNISHNFINTFTANSAGTSPAIYALYSSGAGTGNEKINDNTFYNFGATGSSSTIDGIYLSGGSTTTTIDSNAIYKFNATGTGGSMYTIYLSGINTTVSIDSNIITNITSSGASEADYGIYQAATTATATVNIYSNSITSLTQSGTTSPTIYCIRIVGGPSYNIYSNSINTISASSATTSPSLYGIYTSGAGTGNVNIYNNAINSLTATGTGVTLEGLYLSLGSTTENIYSNTISSLTSSSASGTIYGIYQSNATNTTENIYSNTISSISSTGITSPLIYCIRTATGPSYNIYSNSIYTISAASAATSPTLYAIYSAGSTGSNSTSIYDNNIYGFNATGTGAAIDAIYLSAGTTNIVYNNFISNLTTPASATANGIVGIYANGGTTDEIYYNTIYLNASSSGTNFGSSCVTFLSSVLLDLRDNILANASTPTGTSLSVDLLRTTVTTAGVAPLTTNYASTSNNNDYYVQTITGNYYVYADKATTAAKNVYTKGCGDLSSYQAFMGSGRESHSVFELPPFINISTTPYNLNLSTTTSTECESGGTNITGYATDYYGNIREGNTGYTGSGTAPDIGAEEFSGNGNSDVTPPIISFTPISNMACTTAPTIAVTISDGNGIASGSDAPRLYYKKASDATNTIATVNNSTVNGWKYVTASSISGSVYTFTLNYSLFSVAPTFDDSIRYFVVAQDSSPAKNIYLSDANFSSCPTLIRTITSAYTVTTNVGVQVFKILPTISGSFTVGATGGGVVTYPTNGFNNFSSLTLANGLFAALNNSLLSGNVTVTINANLTSETGANQLNEWQEYSTGTCTQLTPSFTLTIKPATATQYTISGTPAANTALITINGAARVIIDGSYGGSGNYLRFLCSNTADNTFRLTNDDSTVTLKYLQIEQAGTGSDIDIDETIGNSGNYNINISHCIIRDQSTGSPTSIPAYGIWVGGTGTIINTYVSIANNQIYNFSNSGISINSAVNGNNMVIKNNEIFYNSTITVTPSTQQYGINFIPGQGANDTITNNIIGGSTSTGAGTWTNSYNGSFYGMYLQGGNNNTVISNNTINNITTSSTGTSNQLFGIYLFDGLASITNNTIKGLSSASTIAANIDNSANTNYQNAAIVGIESIANYSCNLINNSVNTLSATTTGATTTFVAGIGLDNVGCDVEQNQIYGLTNTATGPAGIAGIRITTGNLWRLENNMISLSNSTNANPARMVGIYDGTSQFSSYYFNSVFIGGSPSTGTATSAAWDCIATGATDSVYDNIFLNVRANTGSASGNHYAISQTDAPAAFMSNFNDLYSAKSADIGNIGGAQTFANWKSNTSGDAQSISDTVLFYGPSTGNLNVDSTSNCYIYHAGMGISGINTDYNSKTRSSTPDIGANEFNQHPVTSAGISPNPACIGNTISLVPSTNVPSPSAYKWIGPSSYTSSSQNPSISSITLSNAGTFSDTITDKIGCKSSSNNVLTVNSPAVITAQPSNVYTCSSNTSTFSVSASSATTYQWEVSTNSGSTWSNLSNGGVYSNVTSSTLTISYPTIGMNGYQYMCIVGGTAPCATNSNAATLTVVNTTGGNWIGATSSDWNTASNWCGGIPTSTTDVVIAAGAPYNPVINASCWCLNLTINSGASVTFNPGSNLNIAGTITNNGTLTNTAGTITFCGSAAQSYPGTSVYNLAINNSSGITLNNDLTVTNSLTLTNGIITTGSHHVIVTNTSGSAISGQSSSSYINGNLRRYVSNGNSYDFPVGSPGNYELAILNLTSSTGITYIDGYFTTGATTEPNPNVCTILGTHMASILNGGYWTISPDNYTSVKYDLTLNETGYSTTGLTVNDIGLIKRHNSTSPWLGTDSAGHYSVYGYHSNANSTLNGTILASVKRTNIHDFSDDGIGSSDGGTTLPIDLVSFTAKPVNNKIVKTTWITATQQNNNYFDVQRSADGVTFESVGMQNGCGSCSDAMTYNLDDTNPLTGTSYYRLKQVNYDSSYTYSDIVAVEISNPGIETVIVYPNPTVDKATIEITSLETSNATINITDVLGRNVLALPITINKGVNVNTLPTGELPKGIYFIEVIDANGQNSFKLKLIKT